MIVVSLVLHWLVSQSIFVVNIQMMDCFGQPLTTGPNRVGHLITIGYSPIAIIFFIVVAGLAIIAVLVTARIRLWSGIPVAGSCSMAIAAACHPLHTEGTRGERCERVDLPLSARLLQWGETGQLNPLHARAIRTVWSERTKRPQPGGWYHGSSGTHYARMVNNEGFEMSPMNLGGDVVNSENVNPDAVSQFDDRVGTSNNGTMPKQLTVINTRISTEEQEELLRFGANVTASDAVFHCSFSADMISSLVEGREYA